VLRDVEGGMVMIEVRVSVKNFQTQLEKESWPKMDQICELDQIRRSNLR
jgi:hypothetical protein